MMILLGMGIGFVVHDLTEGRRLRKICKELVAISLHLVDRQKDNIQAQREDA